MISNGNGARSLQRAAGCRADRSCPCRRTGRPSRGRRRSISRVVADRLADLPAQALPQLVRLELGLPRGSRRRRASGGRRGGAASGASRRVSSSIMACHSTGWAPDWRYHSALPGTRSDGRPRCRRSSSPIRKAAAARRRSPPTSPAGSPASGSSVALQDARSAALVDRMARSGGRRCFRASRAARRRRRRRA